jgi:hypothetical protein
MEGFAVPFGTTTNRDYHQFEERGLGADQGREAIQELIIPEPE